MEHPTKASVLTIFAFLVICGATLGAMLFITRQLTVSGAYWLVPIFGALGGVVGGLLRSENAFELCAYEECKEKLERNSGVIISLKHGRIHLGTLGEIAIGMGGATGAVYLFGGTLRFDERDPKTYVLLVSVSFLAGAFGKKVVETAGERLLKEAKEAKADAKTAKDQANTAAAMGYTLQAVFANDKNQPSEGLRLALLALEQDPKFANAYVEKGRALKRLGKINEALEAIEAAFRINSDKPEVLYNRACYKLLLGGPVGEVLENLGRAIAARPELKEEAKEDPDLKSLFENPEFIKLVQ